MLTVDARAGNPLTIADLAPLRRMLGAHSMVIRVNEDGSLMPFEIMPELFLGRSIRRLLTAEVRSQFENVCGHVVTSLTATVFVPEGLGASDEVMITPVLDDDGQQCRFLVCWARDAGHDGPIAPGDHGLHWTDLELDQVEVRFRGVDQGVIEAAPWWAIGDDGIHLWEHHHRVSSLGLATAVMDTLVTTAVPELAEHDDVCLRIEIPAPEMLNGFLQVLHGTIRASEIQSSRIVLGVPVEMAVDHDLLPIIVHLRTLGAQIDIVGLDALTAKLHTVSDTSDHEHVLPTPVGEHTGLWTNEIQAAVRDATGR